MMQALTKNKTTMLPAAGVVIILSLIYLVIADGEQNELLKWLAGGVAILSLLVIYNLARGADGFSKEVTEIKNALSNLNTGHYHEVAELDENGPLGSISAQVNELAEGLKVKLEKIISINQDLDKADQQISSQGDTMSEATDQVQENFRQLLDGVSQVRSDIDIHGNFRSRVTSQPLTGRWKDLAELINALLDATTSPLTGLSELFAAVSSGDLTRRFDDKVAGDMENLASNINQALETMDGIFGKMSKSVTFIEESTDEMSSSSSEMSTNTREIASSISEMSNGAQTQVVKVDESSNLIEGILNNSNEMGEKAENINKAAKSGVESSEKGVGMVNAVVEKMSEIAQHSNQANDSIEILTERSNEISRVLGMITDIAAQTNLLALNAAIEAAQAGDAGRGFAVVAEEIRKLAEDSRNSAKEIETLVQDVQNDTLAAAKSIGIMSESVKTGQETSTATAESFREIMSLSNETLSFSEEILEKSREQTDAINNVVLIIESVVVIAEETAAGTEQIASSATELSSGMDTYNERTVQLAHVADELKAGIEKVNVSAFDLNMDETEDISSDENHYEINEN